MKKLRIWLVAAAALVSGGDHTPVAAAGVAQPDTSQVCPEIVVLAARGSEQNEHLEPTSYSPESLWMSNGYEAESVRAFLHYAETRHREQTGTSLLADVQVLGVDDSIYPASLPLPALAERGENLDLSQTGSRVGEILRQTPAHVIAQDAVGGLLGGLESGINGTMGFVDAWEARTGCRPGYILIGFSQGAVVLIPQEPKLKERGQLIGSLYIGNPLHPVVSAGPSRSDSVNYCIDGDFACNLTSSTGQTALANGGGVHGEYFGAVDGRQREGDGDVADRFAGWITGYTPRS
jgi:hypothetical protein